jgi:protein translocase SecG subunit
MMTTIAPAFTINLPAWATGLLVVGFLLVSLLMIFVVLLQKPQGGGLSGAFGAAAEGAGQTAFGAKTGDVLTTVTIGTFLLFLSFAVVLNYSVHPPGGAPETTIQSTVPTEEAGDAADADTAGDAAAGDATPQPAPGATAPTEPAGNDTDMPTTPEPEAEPAPTPEPAGATPDEPAPAGGG